MIGVVTTSYPRFADDSAGVFVQQRVRALVAQGHMVEILAAGNSLRSDSGMVTRIAGGNLFYSGGAPEALEDDRLLGRLASWGEAVVFSLAMLGRIAERARRWDEVESHWVVPCGLAVAAALPGLAHRAHVHGGDLHLLSRLPWADSLARVLCRSRVELVFASAGLRDGFSVLAGATPESLGAASRVEAAPFDRSLFFPRTDEDRQKARAQLGFDRPTVLGAGRLVSIKGFDILLAAVGKLPPDSRPVVVIAGQGPEKERLARQARAAAIDLRLPGLLGQRALARNMAAADLFVHACRTLVSGRSEGMPLVVREALARGLPVIASASGGIVELRGEVGLTLVEAADADTLATAIARALCVDR